MASTCPSLTPAAPVAVQAIGDGRVLYGVAPDHAPAAGDWVALERPWGLEAARVLRASERAHDGEGAFPVVVRGLTPGEIQRAFELAEQASSLAAALQPVVEAVDPDGMLAGLRFTLGGEAAICELAMTPLTDEALGQLRAALGEQLTCPVHIEWREPGSASFGGVGRLPTGRRDLETVLRQRFDLPGRRVFAPEGYPRLRSRVRSPEGTGTLLGVSMRTGLASVRLDDGREIAVSPSTLQPEPDLTEPAG